MTAIVPVIVIVTVTVPAIVTVVAVPSTALSPGDVVAVFEMRRNAPEVAVTEIAAAVRTVSVVASVAATRRLSAEHPLHYFPKRSAWLWQL
jgi:hypothetical protein